MGIGEIPMIAFLNTAGGSIKGSPLSYSSGVPEHPDRFPAHRVGPTSADANGYGFR